jgi:hypothetical protein
MGGLGNTLPHRIALREDIALDNRHTLEATTEGPGGHKPAHAGPQNDR